MGDVKAIEGKDGWFYLANDSNDSAAQLSGRRLLAPAQLAAWRLVLDMRRLWMQEQGIHYFFFVVPSKECVYPEFLPDTVTLGSTRPVLQLAAHLADRSASTIHYLLEPVVAGRACRETFSKGDSHWNHWGAFCGYRHLQDVIGRHLPIRALGPDAVDFIEGNAACDLGSKLVEGYQNLLIRARIRHPSRAGVFDNKVPNQGNLQRYTNHQVGNRTRAVVFRDSFTDQMIAFFKESFHEVTFVWQPNIDHGLVDQVKPDAVLSIQAERFLIRVPDDVFGRTNEEIARDKLGRAGEGAPAAPSPASSIRHPTQPPGPHAP